MSIRHSPRHVVVSRLKDAGVTQKMIGDRAGVTQSYVHRVIARRAVLRPTKKTEKVWTEIEKAVAGIERRSA